MRIAGGVFTLAWIAQFVGHGKVRSSLFSRRREEY